MMEDAGLPLLRSNDPHGSDVTLPSKPITPS